MPGFCPTKLSSTPVYVEPVWYATRSTGPLDRGPTSVMARTAAPPTLGVGPPHESRVVLFLWGSFVFIYAHRRPVARARAPGRPAASGEPPTNEPGCIGRGQASNGRKEAARERPPSKGENCCCQSADRVNENTRTENRQSARMRPARWILSRHGLLRGEALIWASTASAAGCACTAGAPSGGAASATPDAE
eukprot:scaffold12163_cov111-Isochrysis_galbana.AAC.5